MSSLRPLTLGSPEAQQREIPPNSDALNGLLIDPAFLWENLGDQVLSSSTLHQSLQVYADSQTP